MGIFKSKDEKRFERDFEVRKGIQYIKKNIKQLREFEKDYVEKAKRAKRISDMEQYNFIKSVLKKTIAAKKMRERQLLSLETAMQLKNQAESDSQFAQAMLSVSKSIAETYGATDLVKAQKEFEKAMMQAESLQQRMELFLETTSESLSSGAQDIPEDIISDADIDKMLEEETAHDEKSNLDKEIEQGLKDIEKELDK